MPRAPDFWWQAEPAWPARLLAPAAALYGAVAARRMARPGRRLDVPVICIGNFVAGGAGKTPTALLLLDRLAARGMRPAVLSRGYGRTRRLPEPVAVDPARHTAAKVGDEPLLLARGAPCFVAADRVAAARAALTAGADVLVMDDGFQNPSLAKTASIVVVDGAAGVGNRACLPAGPLRAPLERQWPLVSLLLLVGGGEAGDALAAEAARRGVPVTRGTLEPDPSHVAALRGPPLLAFAGLGRPEKFFTTLRQADLDIVETCAFPDHHAFATRDLDALRRRADALGARLVTTEKDRVRLPMGFETATLPVRLVLADAAPMDALLDRLLNRRV